MAYDDIDDSDTDFAEYEHDRDLADGSDDATCARFAVFDSPATDNMELGADALLYVMAHGHTITVPTPALLFAEKVAVISIRARYTVLAVLADVNRAMDLIAQSLRTRARLDAETQTPAIASAPATPSPSDGQLVPLSPRPFTQPPSGQKVTIEF